MIFFGIQGALLGIFFVRIVSSFSSILGYFSGIELFWGLNFFSPTVIFAITIFCIISSLIFWLISAGIAHIIARFIFDGMGAYTQLLKLYGYATIPSSFSILGLVIFSLNFSLIGISMLLFIITIFWMVFIGTIAVERCHLIDPGKAFISSFIVPLIIYLIFFSILGMLFFSIGGLLI